MIVNLTPHDVTFDTGEGRVTLPKAEVPARVRMDPDVLCDDVVIDGVHIPIYWTASTGTVTGLPDPKPYIRYLVSLQVYNACKHSRSDLLITHRSVRDADNKITHCAALAVPR